MKTASRTILVLLFSLLCIVARGSDPVLTVRGTGPSEAVRAGSTVLLTVVLDIKAPYHINSDKPLEDYLVPTTLEFEPVSGLEIGPARFPVAEAKMFSFSVTPLAVYEGIVKIPVEVKPGEELKGENVFLKGKIRYQACNDSTCLPPDSRAFTIAFSVSEDDVLRTDSSGGSSDLPGGSDETEVTSGSRDSVDFDSRGLPLTFILVFLGGLALNLTPCVYPMIPITITYFGGQAGGRKGSLVLHSFIYITGMAFTYSLLGVAAALTGGLLGTALQYPPVLVCIALVMVLLALSMFEVYELRMPGFLNRLAGGDRRGFAGTVLMGMTVGIVAAPCIGPFVFGLLTYVGNRGSAVLGFLLFFVLALGMGIPLLILGIFSGSIHRLPRSGEWMVWIRKVFGFVLLAMALFFIRTLMPHPLAYPLALALLLVLAGVYLAWIVPVSGAGKGFLWLRNIVGIGFFIASLVVAVFGIQSYLDSYIGGGIRTGSAASSGEVSEGIAWLPYSEKVLRQAGEEGKPVLIDFYADWCAPCKELDRHTFTDPEVIELSRQFIALKVDLTESGDPERESLRNRYGVLGVPTLVFLKPGGREIEASRVVGFEPADVFLPKMREAYRVSSEGIQPPENGADPSPAS